jgi:hypothetical protein
MERFLALFFFICAVWLPAVAANAADPVQPRTRQARACLAWDKDLHRMLDWSEQFGIHAPELRVSIRAEARKLRERCIRDISMASLNRYVMLMKLLYDDEADEFESFD